MGYWPCQQADGDADDEQVTDRSGQGAHATLGSLTSAEAWANAGYVSSLDEVAHQAQIPQAKWAHRFSLGSLIVFANQRLVYDGVNAIRVFGNCVDGTKTGFAVVVTSTGALQINIVNPTSASNFSNGTSATPYATDSLHSWMLAYDWSTRSFTIGIDGALSSVSGNTAMSATTVLAADSAVTAPTHIGGRPGGTAANIAAVRTKHLHAFNLVGRDLPSNFAALYARYHAHPHLMFSDAEFSWA